VTVASIWNTGVVGIVAAYEPEEIAVRAERQQSYDPALFAPDRQTSLSQWSERPKMIANASESLLPSNAAGPQSLLSVSPPRRIDAHGMRLALFVRNLAGGGAESVWLILAKGFHARGAEVDLVVCRAEGALVDRIPAGIRLVELPRSTARAARFAALRADPIGILALARPVLLSRSLPAPFRHLPALADYLAQARPHALYAALPYENLCAVAAKRLVGGSTRVIISEHSPPSRYAQSRDWSQRYLGPLAARWYPLADVVQTVSAGMAEDLAAWARLPGERVRVVYNPIPQPEPHPLDEPPHPWLARGQPPVVLGMGRLVPEKDWPTLIRAFARVRRVRPARLVILGSATGEAKTRQRQDQLMALARELGVTEDVLLPGFDPGPQRWLARAALFALSSRHEGFGNVLVEALACGCPVVATDAQGGGPREVLGNGHWGPLVPVGDDAALAAAILKTLTSPPEHNTLRRRAADFGLERGVSAYLKLAFAD
jgi:glycosyltransferase involved in cell wall biosynthesis